MRRSKLVSAVFIAVAIAGAAVVAQRGQQPDRRVRVEPGQPCPQGMTEVRRDSCQPPEMPPPSIVDYRPKSTVVAPDHLVPKAKFPLVDIHNHQTVSAANIEQLIKEMDAMNLRVMVNLSGGSGDRLKQNVEFIRSSPHKDRFRVFANVDFNGAGSPGWKEKAAADLETAIKSGAIHATLLDPGTLSYAEKEGLNVLAFMGDLFPYPFQAFAVTDKKLKENPAQVKRWLRAMVNALMFVRDRPEEAAEVGIKRLRVGNITKAAMVQSIKRYNRAVSAGVPGMPSSEGIRNVIEYEVKLPLKIERDVSQESLMNLKLIEQVKTELESKKTSR